MDRRRLLGRIVPLAAVGVTGCMASTGDGSAGGLDADPSMLAFLEMTAVTDATIARRALLTAEEDLNEGERRLIARAITNGSATTTTNGSATTEGLDLTIDSSDSGREIVYRDTVYRVTSDIVEETPTGTIEYTVYVNSVEGPVTESETVRFSAVPSVDRTKLAEKGLDDGKPLDIGTVLVYTEAERNQSALVPEPTNPVIVWNEDRRGRIRIKGTMERTVRTYRYTAERVASATEYGKRIRDNYAFKLAGLSAAERAIVKETISTGHYVVADPAEEDQAIPSPAFRSLVDRFRRHNPYEVNEGVEGTYIVRYGGRTYWTNLNLDDEWLDGEPSA